MEKISVVKIIERDYGIIVKAGGPKVKCPKCGAKSFSVKKDDSYGQCWQSNCGCKVTSKKDKDVFKKMLNDCIDLIVSDWKQELIKAENINSSAMTYLRDERKVSAKVLEYFPIIMVPSVYTIDGKFDGLKAKLEEQMKDAEEMPTKSEKQKAAQAEKKIEIESNLAKVNKVEEDLKNIIKYGKGNIGFVYTDENMNITSIRFRKPKSKEFSSINFQGRGVFKSDFYLDPQAEVIVAEGEFNVLSVV